MALINANERPIPRFDCKACEMHVADKMKKTAWFRWRRFDPVSLRRGENYPGIT
jgi:hypothetical protein